VFPDAPSTTLIAIEILNLGTRRRFPVPSTPGMSKRRQAWQFFRSSSAVRRAPRAVSFSILPANYVEVPLWPLSCIESDHLLLRWREWNKRGLCRQLSRTGESAIIIPNVEANGSLRGMEVGRTRRILASLEKILLICGLLLAALYLAFQLYSALSSRAELQRFWSSQRTASATDGLTKADTTAGMPLFQLWSKERITAYKASLSQEVPAPLAVLRIPAVNLEVPVLQGTDELALNRGVGHIDGTPKPGEDGNIGIAGHRDGFFRALKDIHNGDAIELRTATRTDRYIVEELLIVAPEDVSVLGPRAKPSLTLVTCYPFYFVGSAPSRFIVHAYIADSASHEPTAEPRHTLEKGGPQQNN
jgi:sortase A